MDTNIELKKKRRKKNQNKKKRKQQDGNRLPNNSQINENQKIEELPIVSIKISSSPRPNYFVKNQTEIKRSSGSEFEDFQTPSIEYDIKNENINENDCDDFYDKEWEDMGSFSNGNSENATKIKNVISQKVIKTNLIINKINNEINIKKEKSYIIVNGNALVEENSTFTIDNSKQQINGTFINNVDSTHDFKVHCIHVEENENEERWFGRRQENDIEKKNQVLDEDNEKISIKLVNKCMELSEEVNNDTYKEQLTLMENNENEENGYVKRKSSKSERNEYCILDLDDVLDEENVEIQTNKNTIELNVGIENIADNEVCVSCVDQFFEDLDDECYRYPIEESNHTEMNKPHSYISGNIDEQDNHEIASAIMENIVESCSENIFVESAEKPEIKSENQRDEIFTLVCTEENVNDEILLDKHVVLDFIQPPLIQKSMTLKPRPSIISLKQSATSITNISSISDDNIPYQTEKEIKKIKKTKSKTLKIYTKFMSKFRKDKSPTSETLNTKICDFTLSLKSDDLVKDSEIESNQSLKSNNEFYKNSDIFSGEISPEITKHEIEKAKQNDIVKENETAAETEAETESFINQNCKDQTEIDILEKEKETVEHEKSNLFKNILRKKEKCKKKTNEENIEMLHLQETQNIGPVETNENCENICPKKVEIEGKSVEEFNEALKSLMFSESEVIVDDVVVASYKNQPNVDVHSDVFLDSKMAYCLSDEDDDHLFPDAVTATKIFGFKPPDVPYIDDTDVMLKDAILLCNGESKRFRIHPNFFVPMASMETLYFSGESMKHEHFEKSTISKSSCKNKSILENFIGYMSRGR